MGHSPSTPKDPPVHPVNRALKPPGPTAGVCCLRCLPGHWDTLISFSPRDSELCSCSGAEKEQELPRSACLPSRILQWLLLGGTVRF